MSVEYIASLKLLEKGGKLDQTGHLEGVATFYLLFGFLYSSYLLVALPIFLLACLNDCARSLDGLAAPRSSCINDNTFIDAW